MFLASNGSKQLVLMNSRSKCPFFPSEGEGGGERGKKGGRRRGKEREGGREREGEGTNRGYVNIIILSRVPSTFFH